MRPSHPPANLNNFAFAEAIRESGIFAICSPFIRFLLAQIAQFCPQTPHLPRGARETLLIIQRRGVRGISCLHFPPAAVARVGSARKMLCGPSTHGPQGRIYSGIASNRFWVCPAQSSVSVFVEMQGLTASNGLLYSVSTVLLSHYVSAGTNSSSGASAATPSFVNRYLCIAGRRLA